MKLNKKLMCSAVALGLLVGVSEGHSSSSASGDAKAAYLERLQKNLLKQGLNASSEDLDVFYQVSSDKVAGLLKVWKEAKAAGMGNSDIRAIIGTNKNQAAIDALSKGITNRKGGGNSSSSSSSSSGATYATNAMIDEVMNKVYGKTPTFNDKDKVYDYLQRTMKKILADKKASDPSANIDVKGELKDLISEIKSYKDNDQYGLKAEQVIAFKIEEFDITDWKGLKKLGANFDAVLKKWKQGEKIDQIIEDVKKDSASSSSNSTPKGPTDEQVLANMVRDLGINKPGFSDSITFFNSTILFQALNNPRKNNQGNFVDATAQERTDYLAALRSDLQEYIKDGATGPDLLTLFKGAIPYESWVAYKTNTGKSLQSFVQAIAGGKVFFLPTDLETNKDVTTALAILGLDDTASSSNIKKAYAKLSQKIHPDKNPTNVRLFDAYQNVANAARELLQKKGRM